MGEIGNRFIIDPFAKTSGRKKETFWKTVYNRLTLAKEFSKSSSIFTKYSKDIVPIVEHPSYPPGTKDPSQIFATLVNNSTQEETNCPSSPPRLKDPPQQTTFSTPPEKNIRTENSTNPSNLIPTPDSEEDFETINLRRNPVGMFEATKCLICPATT